VPRLDRLSRWAVAQSGWATRAHQQRPMGGVCLGHSPAHVRWAAPMRWAASVRWAAPDRRLLPDRQEAHVDSLIGRPWVWRLLGPARPAELLDARSRLLARPRMIAGNFLHSEHAADVPIKGQQRGGRRGVSFRPNSNLILDQPPSLFSVVFLL
jgi:hypothetical protein